MYISFARMFGASGDPVKKNVPPEDPNKPGLSRKLYQEELGPPPAGHHQVLGHKEQGNQCLTNQY